MSRFVAVLALGLAGCAVNQGPTEGPRMPALPFPVDSFRVSQPQPRVFHYFIHSSRGPWAIHVLDVDRNACYSAVAVKGAPGAVGRAKTTDILKQLSTSAQVVAGVNADFFLFTPPGVPTNAHITRGAVITGPNAQPVIAFDRSGNPSIVTLRLEGSATFPQHLAFVTGITAWNQRPASGLAWFDSNWGAATDTASGVIEIALDRDHRVVSVDTASLGVTIPPGGGVLVVAGSATDSLRAAALRLRRGDAVTTTVTLVPHPMEAVGGRPQIVRDSLVTAEAAPATPGGFAWTRHPRTAIGIAQGGRRLLLVTVDGRQATYSVGMSLEELAQLMRALGAREAINLDGGGSTTMALADEIIGFRVVNRPSDAAGERPVGNALAIVKGCRR